MSSSILSGWASVVLPFSGLLAIVATLFAAIGAFIQIKENKHRTEIATANARRAIAESAANNAAAFDSSAMFQLRVSGSGNGEEPPEPFEAQALADYYGQALNRATVSFWFSLVFASIGFMVIIWAFLTHVPGDALGTFSKVSCGAIIDAVSSLFFVLANNASKSMSEFFEKLRLDRMNADARKMIDEVDNAERADQLRAQLILKLCGIDKLVTAEVTPVV